MLLSAVRIRDLVILVVRGDDIQEDSTTFENLDLAAALVLISEGRNATVGVDLKEPGFLLLVRIEVQGHNLDDNVSIESKASNLLAYTLYSRPSSSKTMEALRPLGVPSV